MQNIEVIRRCSLLLVLSLCYVTAFGGIRLPGFFSSHMVLQQQAKVNFWGWDGANQPVMIVVSWQSDTICLRTDSNGIWSAGVETPVAGGPYQMIVIGVDSHVELTDVMIGEVLLCSGQSNMAWSSLSNHQEMLEELPNIQNSDIRLLNVTRRASATPQDDFWDSWQVADPRSAVGFSSIGYFAAKRLQDELKVPVGVINASWGGTAAEVWLPQQIVDSDTLLRDLAAMQTASPDRPHLPGTLWNTMIHPLAGYPLAAVFWYQGESNVPTWHGYSHLFSELIRSWRTAWGSEIPFYFVQIAPFSYRHCGTSCAAFLREQQTKALSVAKTGMVVTTDLVSDIKDIHPEKKVAVANRLADLALGEIYGVLEGDYKSPVYDRSVIQGDKVIVSFKNVSRGLLIKGDTLNHIYIAGHDRQFYRADAKVEGNTLIVSAGEVRTPVAVRFGFTDVAMPNLFSTTGLPVSPFRTDDWPGETDSR